MTSDSPVSRAQYLAEARTRSVQSLLTDESKAFRPSPAVAQVPSSAHPSDEASKWRTLVDASNNDHMTALWERYHTDCQMRGISDPYLDFLQKAQRLTHKDIPQYWDLHVQSRLAEEKYPDPFLEFAARMQAALEPETSVSKGNSGCASR